MRVNPPAQLGSFNNATPTLSLRLRRSLNLSKPWVRRVPEPNEAVAPAINIWLQPVYKPASPEYVRPGADDHLRYKSVGNLT